MIAGIMRDLIGLLLCHSLVQVYGNNEHGLLSKDLAFCNRHGIIINFGFIYILQDFNLSWNCIYGLCLSIHHHQTRWRGYLGWFVSLFFTKSKSLHPQSKKKKKQSLSNQYKSKLVLTCNSVPQRVLTSPLGR